MRLRVLLSLLAVATMPSHAAKPPPPFAGFIGDYSRHGAVKVSNGGKPLSGTATLRFTVGAKGGGAHLKVTGKIKIGEKDDDVRRYSLAFRIDPRRRILITNLAPGFDDRRIARGSCTVSARRIAADVPFAFGTTPGSVRIHIELRGNHLTVEQKLDTSALSTPITWKFTGGR